VTPTFRSLSVRNYRLYFTGQLLSNTGTWMQRVGQDWLVLMLSGGSGAALGITTGLQFLPYLLFSMWGGTLADRISRRRLLVITQALMGALALGLGAVTLTGHVTVHLVYAFAFALGVVSAVDNPSRQAFVGEMVTLPDLPNAVALNSASFNLGRILGPAAAGGLIALIGTGWVFVLNGLSFGVTIAALLAMRASELVPRVVRNGAVRLSQGLRYIRHRRDLLLVLVLVGAVGTLGFNFQLTLALMANKEFGLGAAAYGLLSTAMAAGSLAGSLLAARRTTVPLKLVVLAAVVFAVVEVVTGLAPSYVLMLAVLPVVGVVALTFSNAAQSYMQLKTESWVRGRVLGVYTLVFFGGTPLGAPLIGWAADRFGPRSGLILGGLGTLVVTLIAVAVFVRLRRATPATGSDAATPVELAA
jgi:MFS family permease